MKKIITGLALMLMTTVSYATAYECTVYADGAQVGKVLKVNASKASVAEAKAYSRMKKAKIKADYIECK